MRQVNIAGRVEFTDDDESDQLWRDRGRPGQVASMASDQGRPLDDPALLFARAEQLAAGAEELPRLDGHVGLLLVPDTIEFWSGRADRLHDRLYYGRIANCWEHWLCSPSGVVNRPG